MKYGKIVFSREFVSPTVCNLGDIAQTLGLEYIYRHMGISDGQIQEILMEEIGTYRGEKVRLPINGYFRYSREYPAFPTSPDIDPVFLAVYCTSSLYLKHSQFWKAKGPIGCRDEATARAMQKRGYDAFLAGCMTMLFPRREKVPTTPKVFLVDAHPGVEKYIPDDLKAHMERITHDVPVDPQADKRETARRCTQMARELFGRYRDEATLVVTSRLHCAAPCIAMGIPTIVVKDGYDERFGWLDKHTHLYTPDEYEHINWAPMPPDLEDFKALLMRWAVARINGQDAREEQKQIEQYYENRDRKELSTPLRIRGYMWLAQYAPHLASFLREKVLWRFTIAAGSKSEEKR